MTHARFLRHLVIVHLHHRPAYACSTVGKSNENCPEGGEWLYRGDFVRHLMSSHSVGMRKAIETVQKLHNTLIAKFQRLSDSEWYGLNSQLGAFCCVSLSRESKCDAYMKLATKDLRLKLSDDDFLLVRYHRGDHKFLNCPEKEQQDRVIFSHRRSRIPFPILPDSARDRKPLSGLKAKSDQKGFGRPDNQSNRTNQVVQRNPRQKTTTATCTVRNPRYDENLQEITATVTSGSDQSLKVKSDRVVNIEEPVSESQDTSLLVTFDNSEQSQQATASASSSMIVNPDDEKDNSLTEADFGDELSEQQEQQSEQQHQSEQQQQQSDLPGTETINVKWSDLVSDEGLNTWIAKQTKNMNDILSASHIMLTAMIKAREQQAAGVGSIQAKSREDECKLLTDENKNLQDRLEECLNQQQCIQNNFDMVSYEYKMMDDKFERVFGISLKTWNGTWEDLNKNYMKRKNRRGDNRL